MDGNYEARNRHPGNGGGNSQECPRFPRGDIGPEREQ